MLVAHPFAVLVDVVMCHGHRGSLRAAGHAAFRILARATSLWSALLVQMLLAEHGGKLGQTFRRVTNHTFEFQVCLCLVIKHVTTSALHLLVVAVQVSKYILLQEMRFSPLKLCCLAAAAYPCATEQSHILLRRVTCTFFAFEFSSLVSTFPGKLHRRTETSPW